MQKTNKLKDYKLVFNKRIALALINMGHKVVCTMPNPNNVNFLVWAFEKDQSLKEDLGKLIEEVKGYGYDK